MKQVPYWGLKNMWRQRKKFSCHDDLAPVIWGPLFYTVTPFSLVCEYQYFRGACCLYLEGRCDGCDYVTSKEQACILSRGWAPVVLLCLLRAFSPWRWRQHVHPKIWYPPTRLHDVITQKPTTWRLIPVQNLKTQLHKTALRQLLLSRSTQYKVHELDDWDSIPSTGAWSKLDLRCM